MHTCHRPTDHVTVGHVICRITDVCKLESGELALVLGDGHQVSEDLAGVVVVAQRIDDRNG